MDLWLSTMENAVECTPDLISLFPFAISLISYGSENLKKVLKLVETYVVLAPLPVLQVCGEI